MTKKYLNTPEEVIKALKDGKTVKNTGGDAYCLKDGFVLGKYASGRWVVNDDIYSSASKHYIEEQEPLKLEVGKFYKTRNGRKAWVASFSKWARYPYNVAVLGNTSFYSVLESGYYCDSRTTSPEDLVAPW